MTRDQIISLATELAHSLHDADTLDTYTNDIFHELAMLPSPQMTEAFLGSVTSGTATYSFESDMLRIVYAIMHDELLSPVVEADLEAYSATWTTASGTPTQFTQDMLTARTYLLYPIPNFTSSPLIPTHGEPFGEDYPANSLVLIYADDRETDISSIYALPIAFDALSREFTYPSDHTDLNFAGLSLAISQLFYQLLGVK